MKLWLIPHRDNNQRAKLWQVPGLVLLIGVSMITNLSLKGVEVVNPDILGTRSDISVVEIVELTNRERQKLGLSNLAIDQQLTQAAERKGTDMLDRDYWAHITPTGEQPWEFISAVGYTYLYAGENLARDFYDSESVVAAWMDSKSHRENILSSNYKDIGVAVVEGELDGVETTLVVQMFGNRREVGSEIAGLVESEVSIEGVGVVPSPTIGERNVVSDKQEEAGDEQVSPTPILVGGKVDDKGGDGLEITSQESRVGWNLSLRGINQGMSLMIIGLLVGVLLVDLAIVHRRKVVRMSSKPWAHLGLLIVLGIIVLMRQAGQIL